MYSYNEMDEIVVKKGEKNEKGAIVYPHPKREFADYDLYGMVKGTEEEPKKQPTWKEILESHING